MRFKHRVSSVVAINGCLLVVYDTENLSYETNPKISENVQLFDSSGNLIWTVNSTLESGTNLDSPFSWASYDGNRATLYTRGFLHEVDLKTGNIKYLGWVM